MKGEVDTKPVLQLLGPLPVEDNEDTRKCRHHEQPFSLDVDTRGVKCDGCGGPVDAFDALLALSKHWAWAEYRVDYHKQLTAGARSVLADIKRQESNARSRLRRVESKLPDVEKEREVAARLVGEMAGLLKHFGGRVAFAGSDDPLKQSFGELEKHIVTQRIDYALSEAVKHGFVAQPPEEKS